MPPETIGRLTGKQVSRMSETTLIHFYRAEVARSTSWRDRLDTTTNWSITTTVAVISFGFSTPQSPQVVILVGAFAVFVFLVIEARRYRYYDIWARRVRLVEVGYLLPLARREPVTVDFYSALAVEFSKPRLRISAIASLAFRLRRTYSAILGGLLAAWIVKIDIHPTPAGSFAEFVDRAHLGPVPGFMVLTLWLLFVMFYFWLLWFSVRAQLPSTELRPQRKRKAPLADIFKGVESGPGIP